LSSCHGVWIIAGYLLSATLKEWVAGFAVQIGNEASFIRIHDDQEMLRRERCAGRCLHRNGCAFFNDRAGYCTLEVHIFAQGARRGEQQICLLLIDSYQCIA